MATEDEALVYTTTESEREAEAREHALKQLEPASDQLLQQWRKWAQFVFGGGGPIGRTDAELQHMVCMQYDEVCAERDALIELGRFALRRKQ